MATMPVGIKGRKRRKNRRKIQVKLSRQHKPDHLTLEQWQIELRRQFGREQKFRLHNLGQHPVFSEFELTNPQSQNTYRLIIRGVEPGDNYCTCPDFSTNTLGTCKHIEFTLGYLGRKRGKSALREGFQPSFSEVYLQYGSRRDVRFRPGSNCPVELARLAAGYFSPEGTLLPEAFARFENFLAKARELDEDLRCREDVLGFVAEVRDRERRHQRVQEAFPRGIRSAAFKKLLKATLYEYQAEGALFAARAGRCLIGDEMGLGKTIQAVAAAEIMANLFGVERVLIVCPTSLKHQWEREIQRFSERSVQVISGMQNRREIQFQQESFFKVLNYDVVHRDLEPIRAWAPDLVILDEAQRIKNWSTRVARSVKKIVSPYAIVLTGTPLENRLEELISIVQFVDRFRLGPTFRLLHDHQIQNEEGKVIGYRDLDRIGATLEPILIRRKKDEVLGQLPERLDKNFFVPMTKEQKGYHDDNRGVVAQIVNKWRRFKFLTEADQRRLMMALQNMRMSCDSTFLLDQRTDFGYKADEMATLLEEMYETPDTKVVIFSQWLRMHQVLETRFKARKWDYVLFHGGVPGPKRKDLIDRFREEPHCRAFLATDAGSVGLNLQFASAVINMDLPWNPAVLEQRIGRVHRLGQKRPVQVVNFVSQGTIEQGMLGVLQFKKSLFSGILDDGEKEIFLGGTRLSKFLETVEQATAAIPSTGLEPVLEEKFPEENISKSPPRAPSLEVEGEQERETPLAVRTGADPWSSLLSTGLAFLEQIQSAANPPAPSKVGKPTAPRITLPDLVGRDEHTGENYLKVPMPSPEVLTKALEAFGTLLEMLKK